MPLGLKRRDVILAGVAVFIAWGYAVNWAPALRWAGYAFTSGLLIALAAFTALILSISRGNDLNLRHRIARPEGLAFLSAASWKGEVAGLRSRQTYQKYPLYPDSFPISAALDEILELLLRDYVNSWYLNISKSPVFANQVDRIIRTSLAAIREKLFQIDLVEVATIRLTPLLTAHFRDFYDAERAVRGKYLNRNVTESEELDLAIARKFREGKLHPAVSLSYSDSTLLQQEYLRSMTHNLLPELLPQEMMTSRAVTVLVEEIVSCAVLAPIMNLLAEPDTWNQIMEGYGRTVLQDRSTVRKLRAALDEHASPAPKTQRAQPFPRIFPEDNERKFEKFIRAIRKVNNLSDARRFRSELSSQLRKDAQTEGSDPVYLRRLEIGKKMLDQRVNQLAAVSMNENGSSSATITSPHVAGSRLDNASLVELLHDPSGLSYFMEYMDRQHSMSLVQFWIVVDGFRNPLEEDPIEEDELPPNLPQWSESDRTDLAQIHEAYLSRPELDIPEISKQAVRTFLKVGKAATQEQYYVARSAILRAQTGILEKMQARYFEGFKKSDLFYKCLTSQEASSRLAPTISANPFDEPFTRPPPARATTTQGLMTKAPPLSRVVSSRLAPTKKVDLQRSSLSSTDIASFVHRKQIAELTGSQKSLDGNGDSTLFDDGDVEGEALSGSVQSLDQDLDSQDGTSAPDTKVVQAVEAALNDIMEDKQHVQELRTSLFDEIVSPESSLLSPRENDSPRSSVDTPRTDLFAKDFEKPSITSLGLVNPASSRLGVFTDDDLFPDEEKFLSDEHDDPEEEKEDESDDIQEAAPGDLGLAEAITALTSDIDRLHAQDAVVDSLTRKAELTNNTAELRILRKSKASLEREIRRKELQRQQYVIQESDNSLYGRSTIRIKSIMVGKEDDGHEYAVYVIEVNRNAGEQMPAASWTITRRYSEFHELHQRLRERYPSVRHLEFPRRRMVLKLQNDFLHKRRLALEKYLRALLLLPEVCRSRDLRAFLSQRAIGRGGDMLSQLEDKKDMITRFYNSVTDGMEDILGNIPVLDQLSTAGQNLISAASNQLATMPVVANDDSITAAEAEAELNAFENRELEPFVKPICDIFLEVFELNRGNNWLRGRAVVVVLHQLLGGTIERKVRENVKNLVQEEAVIRYVTLLKDTLWPNGHKREAKARNANEKTKSRQEASLMLATLVPDLAGNVVGRVNAQAASRRIFATFNNPRLNAHLAFTLLDEIIDVFFGGSRA